MSSREMTGDIKNNIRKLQLALRKVGFEKDIDLKSITAGEPHQHLRIYHHLFTDYSCGVAKLVMEMGIELRAKTDLRFMEAVYKILREMFSYRPPLTREQFFSASFAERKIIMSTEVVDMVYRKHRSMPRPKSAANSQSKSGAATGVQMRTFNKSSVVKLNASSTLPETRSVQKKKPVSAPSQPTTGSGSGHRGDARAPGQEWSSSPLFGDRSTSDKVFSYSFNEPIDIVAMTPTNGTVTERQRTSSPINQTPAVQPSQTALTEQQVLSLIEETVRARVEDCVREKLHPELETLRARVFILENKVSILQASLRKLTPDLEEKVATDVVSRVAGGDTVYENGETEEPLTVCPAPNTESNVWDVGIDVTDIRKGDVSSDVNGNDIKDAATKLVKEVMADAELKCLNEENLARNA